MQNFFEKVYKTVKKIPKGKVKTYGQIAEILGTKDTRKVGWALHANRDPKIPCHRVVNREGKLASGYTFGGREEQRNRLLAEKVKFQDRFRVKMD